jgi:hypothetical protein
MRSSSNASSLDRSMFCLNILRSRSLYRNPFFGATGSVGPLLLEDETGTASAVFTAEAVRLLVPEDFFDFVVTSFLFAVLAFAVAVLSERFFDAVPAAFAGVLLEAVEVTGLAWLPRWVTRLFFLSPSSWPSSQAPSWLPSSWPSSWLLP